MNRQSKDLADFQKWLHAAQEGSKDAMGRALEASRTYLLLVAQREMEPGLAAKGGASDVVQDTFLEAHRDFGQFHGTTEKELLAWLRRILLNNLANFTRDFRQREKRDVGREVSMDTPSGEGGVRGWLADDTTSPSGKVIRAEEMEAVSRAIDRLPEQFREVVVLRHREQLTFEQIGELTGRTAEAARKMWSRGIERLREELGED